MAEEAAKAKAFDCGYDHHAVTLGECTQWQQGFKLSTIYLMVLTSVVDQMPQLCIGTWDVLQAE